MQIYAVVKSYHRDSQVFKHFFTSVQIELCMNFLETFDIIVIGAGHAGCEAALAAARMGCKTALFTMNLDTIARMPCNPAIGGIGKGHLVKEIDALGGEMARIIDATGIQFRRLNTKKGPAVQASRAQADRLAYHTAMRKVVENTENLHVRQGRVEELITESGKITGIICYPRLVYGASAVINTAGTFLNGLIHIGLDHFPAGRDGEFPSEALSENYRDLGFEIGRLKTGTPPRVDGNTIDFESLVAQHGDNPIIPFSFRTEKLEREQVCCYITHTTEETHEIIRKGLDRSPLYSGIIVGVGPRYCPSIETKIVRFHDKPSHHIFLEPEGLNTTEYYVNGLATSLPFDVQMAMIHSIPGLEKTAISRPGYAIEYDFFPPTQLLPTLETKIISGLYHAGQINGTSGYEEAAAQGMVAGINAVLKLTNREPFILHRDEAYIAVMIDDLINQGVLEPYRMFTSRAEYRLLLREDNADKRLTEYGRKLDLVKDSQYRLFQEKYRIMAEELARIDNTLVQPDDQITTLLLAQGAKPIESPLQLKKLIARPNTDFLALRKELFEWPSLDERFLKTIEFDIKYEGYVRRQEAQVDRMKNLEKIKIPVDIAYEKVHGLTLEIIERLNEVKPLTLAQASRIPGITPAALSILMIYFKSGTNRKEKQLSSR